MNSRERVRSAIERKTPDQLPVFDSFWNETLVDFHKQGLPLDQSPENYFDFDIGMIWFEQSFLLPETIKEETESYLIKTDGWGTLQREIKNEQTTPGLLGFAVKDRQTWEKDFRPSLKYDPSRIDWAEFTAKYKKYRARDKYVVVSVLGPFECTWHKIGPEEQFTMLAEDPGWLMDMYEADIQLVESAWQDHWQRGIQPDALWIYEDIGYNKGMLFSPRHYQKYLQPYHKRLCDLAHRFGAQVIYHSDGNINKAVPLLIDAGVDCLHPMEVKAEMDVLELKRLYGHQLAFMGNIDARLFQSNDLPGLEKEIRQKLPQAMRGGGYIYHSDHSIPPGTRFDTYRYALDLIRKIGADLD